jgi:aminopeptidase N
MCERRSDRGWTETLPLALAPVALAVVFALLVAAGASWALAGDAPDFHHSLVVSIYPSDQRLRVVDSIYVEPEAVVGHKISFLINKSLSVETVTGACSIKRWYTQEDVDPALFKANPDSEDIETVKRAKGLFIEYDPAATCYGWRPIVIAYSGVIHDSLAAPSKSYAKGFETTTGLIGDEGVYLSSESLWYPFQLERMFSFRMKVDVPADWRAVSQGALVREAIEQVRGTDGNLSDRRLDVWAEPNPAPELYLIAGKYFTHEDAFQGIKIMTYTYEPSDSLCKVYIDATKRYLAMYGGLIGPYPFAKFALVENFWQTGYGMPSFTLLGSKVIRLPFIVNTSYGHEILHNWWGNSVYVDYDEGNWCEGLTTYGADYLYKEKMGPEQARDYRHHTLIGFNDYVSERKDFPLSDFLERSDAATQSVGYGKSLMVYHMLRQSLGDSLFWAGLRDFYARYKFKMASWGDLTSAFEETSGEKLTWFFDQWVRRAGAPMISLADVDRAKHHGKHMVRFTLKQVPPVFTVDLPVRVETTHGTENFRVRLSGEDSTYSIETRSEPLALAIDPDFDVFRRLYLEEVPLTLGGVFARDSIPVVLGASEDEGTRAALKEVATSWDLARNLLEESPEAEAVISGKHVWLMGRGEALKTLLAPLRGEIEITGETVKLADSTYTLKGNTLVFAIRNPHDERLAIGVVLTQDPEGLKGLAGRLPHYSSYSYLLFEKDKPIAKGVWKERRSPLKVDFRER